MDEDTMKHLTLKTRAALLHLLDRIDEGAMVLSYSWDAHNGMMMSGIDEQGNTKYEWDGRTSCTLSITLQAPLEEKEEA